MIVGTDCSFKADALRALPRVSSEVLREATAKLVHAKYRLDRNVAEDSCAPLTDGLHDGGYGPQEASTFFRNIFPFAQVWTPCGERFSAMVPVSQTFGCSWAWRGRHLSAEERRSLIAELCQPVMASSSHSERAVYFWIPGLDLLLPHEGKNRVDFLREAGATAIPALVRPYTYPEAERLALYRVRVNGLTEWWAVLDGRWVERLSYPDWTVPVLSAYGVKQAVVWPAGLPETEAVASAFSTPTGHLEFLNPAIVDLSKVSEQLARKACLVTCSIHDIKVLRPRWSYWMRWYAASMLCFVAALAIPSRWPDLKFIATLGAGVGIGLVMALVLPGFLVARDTVERPY